MCTQSCLFCELLWRCGLKPGRLLCLWDFPGKNMERVAISYTRGSFWPRDAARLLRLLHWQAALHGCATREARVKRQQGPSHASINCETERRRTRRARANIPRSSATLQSPPPPHSSRQGALVSWFRNNKTRRNGLLPFFSRLSFLEGLPGAASPFLGLLASPHCPVQGSPPSPPPHQLLIRHSPGAEFYSQSLVFIWLYKMQLLPFLF